MDALRASWSGQSPFGRVVTEGVFDASLFKRAEGPMGEDLDDGTWDIRNEDFTGFEDYAHELAGMPDKRAFEMRKFALIERQRRIEVVNNHGGVLPQMIAHILDPTVLIGYGVVRAAARGVPALVVGARVAAVEVGIVATEYGIAAAKYEDFKATDAVRAAAYAGMFGFVLGSSIAKVSGSRPGRLWAAAGLDVQTRQQAAAARQTVMHTINETAAGSAERAERVTASYQAPITRVAGLEGQHTKTAQTLAQRLGLSLDDVTDEKLVELYQAGDKTTRQRITKLRNELVKSREAGREKRLLELERAMAEGADTADGWKANTLAALLAGRRGLPSIANMLPRAQATALAATEAGFDTLPPKVNEMLGGAHKALRDGARLLTRSNGLDNAPGEVLGASVEDLFLMEITRLYKNDEMLRTAAIHAIKGQKTPVAWHTPVIRNLKYNVGAWAYNKAGELPGVVGGQRVAGQPRWKGWGPMVTAEDELESAMQRLSREATVSQKGTLDMSKVDVADEVKALFEWRQNQYVGYGKRLRDKSIPYLQRELDSEVVAIEVRMDALRETMDQHPPGSQAWQEAWNEWLDAEAAYTRISEQAEAYRAAEDVLYQPVTLMPHKVRGDQAGFVEAAYQHFITNPHVKLRRTGRIKGRGENPTRTLDEPTNEIGLRGRALALWYATVERVDYAGRPVGKMEFVRRLEAHMERLAPGRAGKWEAWKQKMLGEVDQTEGAMPPLRFPSAQTIEEAAWDSLNRRVETLRKTGDLSKDSGGRYLQSEMFATSRLDPKTFAKFIEDRPTVQFRAYLEREVRRVHAAERLGDPDGMNPMVNAKRTLDELEFMNKQDTFLLGELGEMNGEWFQKGLRELLHKTPTDVLDTKGQVYLALERALDDALPGVPGQRIDVTEAMAIRPLEVPQQAIDEITQKIEAYDLLRRQMMGEVLFEGNSAFMDKMNAAVSVATNISTAADLGMAGYSVSIDLGQMLAYYGMNPLRLGRLLKQVMKDPTLRAAMADPKLRFELGVAGEVQRGARLRAIQGADLSFGNQGGFVASGHYWADMGRWIGNFYAEASSNIMTASLLNPITDLTQMLAAPLAVTKTFQSIGRVVKGVGSTADANTLRRLGIDDDMARRIWVEYEFGNKGVHKAPGVVDDLAESGVVILPEFSSWRDPQLAQHVMAMIGGDIRVATLHPGIATNRIWTGMGGALHTVSRLYYLFTRWSLVASENVYGKNIEDGTYQGISTAIAYSTLLQATINWMKEPDFVETPMLERLGNALVMSGSFGYMGVMNERLERMSGHQLGLRPMMGLDTFAHDPDSARFRLAALGPVAGKVGAAEETLRKQNYGQFMRLFMPYQNFWAWSGAVRDASDFLDFEDE